MGWISANFDLLIYTYYFQSLKSEGENTILQILILNKISFKHKTTLCYMQPD